MKNGSRINTFAWDLICLAKKSGSHPKALYRTRKWPQRKFRHFPEGVKKSLTDPSFGVRWRTTVNSIPLSSLRFLSTWSAPTRVLTPCARSPLQRRVFTETTWSRRKTWTRTISRSRTMSPLVAMLYATYLDAFYEGWFWPEKRHFLLSGNCPHTRRPCDFFAMLDKIRHVFVRPCHFLGHSRGLSSSCCRWQEGNTSLYLAGMICFLRSPKMQEGVYTLYETSASAEKKKSCNYEAVAEGVWTPLQI